MAKLITESVALNATKVGSGRIRIKIIDAGEGSSGSYPAETIEAAVKDGIFAKGLHMYADHPGATENYDRPERTIRDLAAVLDTDAVYVPEEQAAYAEAKVFPQWREVISEMANDIGVSIRGTAEVDDSSGKRVITKLVTMESVDFVTKEGRGGKITEVLESFRAATRAIGHGVAEATANDTREWLRSAVSAAHGGDEIYVWVRDFDEANVWFEKAGDDGESLYQQAYTLDGNTAALAGDPIPVRIETRYVPIAAASESTDSPSNPAGVTENRKEPTVATTNIEESELSALRADASRAAALEADNKALRESAVKADAAKIVAEAFDGIDAPRTIARLAESYKLTESGQLAAEALKAVAEESAAEWKVAHGAGSVSGVGNTASVQEARKNITDDDIVAALNGGK